MRARDTSLEAERTQIAILRRMGLSGRAQMTLELSEALRAWLKSGVRHRHPDYTEEQVGLAALRLAIGKALFEKAFPGRDIEP